MNAAAADYALLAALNIGVFISAVLVLIMQPGFMLLEAGSVSRKNALNNIFKNVIDFCLGGVVFWFVGYAIFIGQEGWALDHLRLVGLARETPAETPGLQVAEPLFFLFQFGFASASVTISSGAVTGRISPYPYMAFSCLFVGLIYPLVGFMVWSPHGLLYGVFQDFAGSVVVHASGAAAGLAGALLLGPRLGYNGYDPINIGQEKLFRIAATHAPHNMPLAALGVFLLWIGWFGFNGGTLLAGGAPVGAAVGEAATSVDHLQRLTDYMADFGVILVNTALAPCAAAGAAVLIQALRREDLSMPDMLNSIIAGLVAVTAGADALSAPAAMAAGAGAAVVFRWTKFLMVRATVDDPVAAVSAHGLTGVFGAVCVALAAEPGAMTTVAISQLLHALALFSGVFVASVIAFKLSELAYKLVRLLVGRDRLADLWRRNHLRIGYGAEVYGLDDRLHGQDAYNFRSMR